ncbi:MAG TPA: glycosyltransferase N-terminal domain-containing protein [Gemmatimonadaceae bacterium]|nr:glycosyltransferase N-terminal domain-containing protein [Gemmatimonadaceae bacterium]
MRALLAAAYEVAARLALVAAHLAPVGQSKLARTLRARRGLADRYRAWATAHRDVARPLLWMHAPSVGEGLQARPVLERLRDARPDVQLAYTHFSPSAEAFAARLNVDFRDYLPFDAITAARGALDTLRPTVLVFSKVDVWPTLTREARTRGVRLGLISATLAARSSRRGGFASAMLRDAYARLDAVGAIDGDDAERLTELGVRRDVIEVTGDTRYDQVWARAAAVDRSSALLAPLISTRPTLVAGSTWPADERVLLAAWPSVRRAVPEARLIIAPHEPTATHLAPIERWAEESGITHARLGATAAQHADVVVVDRVGVLGDLYALASVAFVGGGFHAAGLHSVIEPAAFGAPVTFGPRWQMSRDAALLLRTTGALAVASPAEMVKALREWLISPSARRDAGDRAREMVRSGLGAAERTVALVVRLLDRR